MEGLLSQTGHSRACGPVRSLLFLHHRMFAHLRSAPVGGRAVLVGRSSSVFLAALLPFDEGLTGDRLCLSERS